MEVDQTHIQDKYEILCALLKLSPEQLPTLEFFLVNQEIKVEEAEHLNKIFKHLFKRDLRGSTHKLFHTLLTNDGFNIINEHYFKLFCLYLSEETLDYELFDQKFL